jgi:hypothetical protein
MHIEMLEPRQLLAAAVPTAVEQYFLELVNRARMNPTAEARRFQIDLNEGLAPGILAPTPRQPLAFNRFLISAARKYSTALLDPPRGQNNDPGKLNHFLNGTSPGSRAVAEGYPSTFVAENLAWNTHSGSAASAASADKEHELLFKDFTDTFAVEGRGHRLNILNNQWNEVGIGLAVGAFGGRNAQVVTQDFGLSDRPYLMGVAYNDKVADNDFYDPGEGLKGIAIKATRLEDGAVFSTKAWASGGYSLALDPGMYTVTASGKALGAAQTYFNVAIGVENVKRDFVAPGTRDLTAPFASAIAANVTEAGGTTHRFIVTYSDTSAIDVKTIRTGNVRVTAGGFAQTARLVSTTPAKNGTSVVATYEITAPGGAWTAAANGTYAIKLLKGQVKDTSGRPVPQGTLGSFVVNVI